MAVIYSYHLVLLYSALPVFFRKPSGFFPGRGLFTYLLTGLLTDLLTERDFTAYGAAYRDCLRRWLSTDYQGSQLAHCDRKGPKPGACMGWAIHHMTHMQHPNSEKCTAANCLNQFILQNSPQMKTATTLLCR